MLCLLYPVKNSHASLHFIEKLKICNNVEISIRSKAVASSDNFPYFEFINIIWVFQLLIELLRKGHSFVLGLGVSLWLVIKVAILLCKLLRTGSNVNE